MGIGQEHQPLTVPLANVSYWAIKYETPANEFHSHMRQRSTAGGAVGEVPWLKVMYSQKSNVSMVANTLRHVK